MRRFLHSVDPKWAWFGLTAAIVIVADGVTAAQTTSATVVPGKSAPTVSNPTAPAQAAPSHPRRLAPDELFQLVRDADEAFRKFDYPRATELYQRITAHSPYLATNWERLARCQERLDQFDRAIASWQRVLALGDDSAPGFTQFQIARLYAQTGDKTQTLEWLEKSLAARHEHPNVLRTDSRFSFLHSDPRFVKLAAMPVDADKLSREERWGRDLAYLAAEAARMHVLWHEGDRAARFREAVERTRSRVAELTDEQLIVEIQKAIVLLGDGHSGVRSRGKLVAGPRLPLRFYFFSDGLFVIDAAKPYADLIGCRVEKIGSASVPDAVRLLEQVVSHDNPMGIKWQGPFSLTNPERLRSLGIIEDSSSLSLEVTDRTGSRRTVKVKPGEKFEQRQRLFASKLPDAPPTPLYLKRVEDNFWLEPLADIDGLYVQFNQVVNQSGRTIAAFAQELREYLDAHPTKTLVIDVRHNSGGDTYLYLKLLKTLMHYELSQPDGKLFAIIGRNTFSACQNFATDVDRLTDASFVGEPTGSSPNMAGESTETVLPYSGLGVSISTRFHQHSYPTDRRIWIAPDIPAELSSIDYFANRDPALEAVRAIVQRKSAER